MDRYDDTPLHESDAQRRIDRDLEQQEWEHDPDYMLYRRRPDEFRKRVIQTRVRYLCTPCECGGQCERCAA